jgi:predicted flap endonuclease-1-like 5' DNA nuclease
MSNPINMSAVAIFAGAFLILAAITFVFPGLPPAQLLYELLNIPQLTIYIWVIPVETLLYCVINGLIWATFAAAVYSLALRRNIREPLYTIPAQEMPETPPKPEPLDARADRIPPAITVTKKPGRIEQDIETIEGIGAIRGRMLRNSGIRTIDDLLRAGTTKLKRQRLANKFGVSYTTIEKWVYRADLLRIRGIGRQYSELLENAGVNTVTNLSIRNSHYLWQKLKLINRERKLVKRIPTSKQVETWVHRAKTLEPIIQ